MDTKKIIDVYRRTKTFLKKLPPDQQKQHINLLVDFWGLADEGLGYVVGRLVECGVSAAEDALGAEEEPQA